ncbi:TonB-dependent receptor [Paraflavitalea sp. CAU 1676]|uniref:TonB-dependent receptor n=1 Tax=Paraflavitalea sp. CAU 1676 TaxID=3032598 RepID=UPI0023D9BAD4|nr:TonB-dependent receptor [Paraflavitalea sp. CAU 1676]MDF2191116.1 TonB-dependent receptor [Paraflavitalea sp. CAU 1676]
MLRSSIRILSLFLTLLTFHDALYAQGGKPLTISGYVRDAASGEVLINATITVSPVNATVQSNAYGYFSVTLPSGKYTVNVSYTGYSLYKTEIDLTESKALEVTMQTAAAEMDKVVVTGEKRLRRTNTVALGIQQLSMGQIKKIPAFMGEPDVVKALLTLPGITSVGEGASGFNVRGGNVDENLIIMDEAPVYNSSHLLGFFSVFNPDAVKNVTLYKSAFPAEYGGRTSSVLDIRMKEGNNQKLTVNGGISTIFSRLSIEGPIQKDKSSFIIAGRRSYIDVLSKPFLKEKDRDNKLYFYDLTAKANLEINDKNTIYLSGYFGRDVFGFGNEAGFEWGNTTGTFRWNHLFNPRLFLNTSVYYSKYDYKLFFSSTQNDEVDEKYDWNSNIQTYGVKPSLTWFINNKHQLKTGVNVVFYDFYPGKGVATSEGVKNDITLKKRFGSEMAAYLEDTWKLSRKWQIQGGVRVNQYAYLGNTTVYYFRDTTANVRKPLDREEVVTSKKKVADWAFFEPRLSVRYELKKNTFLKAGYARSSQYLHLLSNTASPTPVDLYFPSTNNIKPSVTDQVSVGMVTIPEALPLEFSAEVFYKKMDDVLDYIDNANLELNQMVEADLLTGKGRSWGVELEVKKETGKWQGWVNYTYSRSERQTPGISKGEWYLSRYDRTHVVNAAVTYSHNKKWDFSANFNLGSGTPATFPDVRLDIQGIPVPYNSSEKRNNFRLPAYHRLDVAATMKGRQGKKFKQEWVFGIYNLYARQNAYTIYFRQNQDEPQKKEAVRLSILGSFIPSITWNFKF